MPKSWPTLGLILATAGAAVLVPFGPGTAEACRVLDFSITPSSDAQIIVWLEDTEGNYVTTLYVTNGVGIHGLGNRPGIMEFNSQILWPYGRRESVFPVWAHKHGTTYPLIVFRDGRERDLSHGINVSSRENYFCRPLDENEDDKQTLQNTIDTGTCATMAFTDKGQFSAVPDGGVGLRSLYPPRADLTYNASLDHPDVQQYATTNDLDAISRATPVGGAPYQQSFLVPGTIANGDYVLRVEVSKEFDQNATYAFPSPTLSAFGQYGLAYRGQPSVVYSLPLTIDNTSVHSGQTSAYEGYGDPDGADGDLRPPDDTITSDTEGSGAQRLLLASGPDGAYRVRAVIQPSDSTVPPGAPISMAAEALPPHTARVSFVEPEGNIKAYEVRVSAGTPLTAQNFDEGQLVAVNIVPQGSGTVQTVNIGQLLPSTHYWVGVRAQDSCLAGGAPTIVDLVTAKLESGEVSACFVATAAFGSPMVKEVSLLRSFRDQILRRQALGEIFVESYYTFGPALAGVIRPSDTLRAIARAALGPVIDRARALIE